MQLKRCGRLAAAFLMVMAGALALAAQETSVVSTVKDEQGWKLQVDERDFVVKGVVWSYTPLGENYSYDLWSQPDAFIERMLEADMPLIKKMGANTIRCFSMIPARWVSYIYDRYGIYTMVNDLMGRYGVSVDGRWMAKTDYSDPGVRRVLLAQFAKTVAEYKDVRGVLCFMLGNESNYGLEWSSDAIENLPSGERLEAKARYLYSLFGEAIRQGKAADPNHPIGIVNGDVQYLNVIKAECGNLDILGVNSYRGRKAFDLFYAGIAETLDRPVIYTEIGADAFNVVSGQEDQLHQAEFILAQWEEMYLQSWGKGKTGNVLGACVFEWVDEWWKHGMEKGLDLHDTEGTWSNGAYEFDAVAGRNNMNEEWFGIAAQSTLTDNGINRRLPRAAYFVLQKAWSLDWYNSSAAEVKKHFAAINTAALGVPAIALSLTNTLAEQTGFVLDGSVVSRAFMSWTDKTLLDADFEDIKERANFRHMETAHLSLGWKPFEGLEAGAELRVFGSPFYPTPTTPLSYLPPPGEAARKKDATSPVELYAAWANFQSEYIDADFHLHDGHADWYMEGDFFNLLPEAFDRYTMDRNGSLAPFGLELRPKGFLEGLTVYAGPELYYGGFPMLMAKYYRDFGQFAVGAVHQEELTYPTGWTIGGKTDAEAKLIRPLQRSSSLFAETDFLPIVKAQLGVLLAGTENIGKTYDKVSAVANGSGHAGSAWALEQDLSLTLLDCLAGKLRLSTDIIPMTQLYLQGVVAGAVADSKAMLTRSGSQIADPGVGNRWDAEAGAIVSIGPFVVAPKFLYRQPIYLPLPDINAYGSDAAVVPRNYMDPFYVFANRAAIQGEMVLGFDPTGATYLFDWNNDDRENAQLAGSVSFLYNFYQGATDAREFVSGSGSTYVWSKGGTAPDGSIFAHSGLAAVSGTWSVLVRLIGEPVPGLRFILSGDAGTGQSTSMPTDEFITYYGGNLRLGIDRLMVEGGVRVNAWGPDNWFREFNINYPLQWNAGVSWGLAPLSFMSQENRFGILVSGQELDEYSDPNVKGDTTNNLARRIELQAYLNLTL